MTKKKKKKFEKVMLYFEYNPETCPLAIAKMTLRFLK